MRKPLRLVNLLLGIIAVVMTAALARTWVAPEAPTSGQAVKRSSPEVETVAYNPTARPPLAQFDILLEKNPFKQPPPQAARPGPPPPPPIPLPTLAGTIFVGNERKAILNDRGKANIYAIGQEIAGGVVAEIGEDRIIFKRGDATQEIALKAAIEPAAVTPAKVPGPATNQTNGPNEEEIRRRRQEREERRARRAAERAMERP